jgi:hypothetical protein
MCGNGHDHAAGVVHEVRGFDAADPAAELQVLRDPQRAAGFTFDANDLIEVVGERAAEVVIAEAGAASFRGEEGLPPGMSVTSTAPGPTRSACAKVRLAPNSDSVTTTAAIVL